MSHRVRLGVERGEDRLGERVADDGDAAHPLALDGVEQLGGVEACARRASRCCPPLARAWPST